MDTAVKPDAGPSAILKCRIIGMTVSTAPMRYADSRKTRRPYVSKLVKTAAHRAPGQAPSATAAGASAALDAAARLGAAPALATPAQAAPDRATPTRVHAPADPALAALLPAYLERRAADARLLAAALAGADWPTIAAIGHRLKGLGSTYGHDAVSAAGRAFEAAAAARDATQAQRVLDGYTHFLADQH